MIVFVREAIQRYPQLKAIVVSKLLEVFPQIKSPKLVLLCTRTHTHTHFSQSPTHPPHVGGVVQAKNLHTQVMATTCSNTTLPVGVCVCGVCSIHRASLWILGEYCTSVEDISCVLAEIKISLGEVRDVCIYVCVVVWYGVCMVWCMYGVVYVWCGVCMVWCMYGVVYVWCSVCMCGVVYVWCGVCMV